MDHDGGGQLHLGSSEYVGEQQLRLLGDEQGIISCMHAFHSCVKVVGSLEHVAANYWYNLRSALTSPALTMRIGRIQSGN
jgi:hypothetical protein